MGCWAGLYDLTASFKGLLAPGVLDYDGLDLEFGGCM